MACRTRGGPSFDDIANQHDGSTDAGAELMALDVGGASGTTEPYVTPRDGDGEAGCIMTTNASLVVSASYSSDAAVATVRASEVGCTSYGDVKTLTITPLSRTCTASDDLSGLADVRNAGFTLIASNESASAATPTTVSRTVTDDAGNATTRTLSALIDLTKPTVSGVSFLEPDIPVGSSAKLTATVGDVLGVAAERRAGERGR